MSVDPFTLALTGLKGAISVADTKSQQKAANQQAALAEQEAARQRRIAEINARRIADKNRAIRSKAFAKHAAGGGDPTSGSALLVQKNLAAGDSLEQALAIHEGEVNAQNFESQALAKRSTASDLKKQAIFNTGTTLLGQFQ